MKIGIFDTEHFETTYALIRLFDLPGNVITVYTDDRCKKQLEGNLLFNTSKYQWELQQHNESNAKFIGRVNRLIRIHQTQLLFYNTIGNNHLLHALLLKNHDELRTILTIHDINDMFETGFALGIKKTARNLGKKMLLHQVKELNVITETLNEYLRKKTGDRHIIHNIPGAVFETPPSPLSISGSINLVVPGSVDRKRKNYLNALELLINADAQKLKIDMVFLGAPRDKYGLDIIELTSKINLKYASVKAYGHEIPQQQFDNEIRDAHFVYLPVVETSKEDGKPAEIYGRTKASGSIFDSVRNARPMIIPNFLQVPTDLEKSCMRYRDGNNLLLLLKELLEHPEQYLKWQENALSSAKNYSVENIRAKLPSFFS